MICQSLLNISTALKGEMLFIGNSVLQHIAVCYAIFYQPYLKNFTTEFLKSHCLDNVNSANIIPGFIILFIIVHMLYIGLMAIEGWEPIMPGTVLIKNSDQSCQAYTLNR